MYRPIKGELIVMLVAMMQSHYIFFMRRRRHALASPEPMALLAWAIDRKPLREHNDFPLHNFFVESRLRQC